MRLHSYAKAGDLEGVRRALNEGESIDTRDERDFTPLAYAASSDEAGIDMLDLCIAAGADVNSVVDKGQRGALSLAACSGSHEKVRFLLAAGADIHFRTSDGRSILLDTVYGLGKDPGLVPMLELLVEYEARVNFTTRWSESPVSAASQYGRYDAIARLVELGADPAPLEWNDVMWAVACGTPADVARTLEASSTVEGRDYWKRTPWLLSAMTGEIDKAKLLRAARAKEGVRDDSERTATMICAERGHSEMLSWLIESKVGLEDVDGYGRTALMLAAEGGQSECVALLLRAGANPRTKSPYGDSAMKLTADREVARLLVAAGESLGDLSHESTLTLLGLEGHYEIAASRAEYDSGHLRRFGRTNPEAMDIPFWRAMVRSGVSAFAAQRQFQTEAPTCVVGERGVEDDEAEPGSHDVTWCFQRFGMSLTELPDGRYVQIAGEHEDFYDPDFCIYNDVFVHGSPGEFQIYGYPRSVFPPTDFHTATWIDGFIFIIGSLGYVGQRRYGTTPIYRLDCTTWQIAPVRATGECPGWIYDHQALRVGETGIEVSGGTILVERAGEEHGIENYDRFLFDTAGATWTKR